jgi:hypothetical protein
MIALLFSLAGCSGDARPLQSAMDSIVFPPSWETARTVVKSGESGCPIAIADPYCPSVTRYFVVDGDLPSLLEAAKGAIVAQGFGDVQELTPTCDRETTGALCSLDAAKGDIQIEIDLYPPGKDVDALGLAVSDHATVRIIVR